MLLKSQRSGKDLNHLTKEEWMKAEPEATKYSPFTPTSPKSSCVGMINHNYIYTIHKPFMFCQRIITEILDTKLNSSKMVIKLCKFLFKKQIFFSCGWLRLRCNSWLLCRRNMTLKKIKINK